MSSSSQNLDPAADLGLAAPVHTTPRSLSTLPGGEGRVVRVDVEPADAARLKALGICVGRRVQVVQAGDPLIVRVVGARVGLSAQLAAGVFVVAADASTGATAAA